MKKIFLVLLTIIYLKSSGQSNITVGEKAPQITITNWIANVPKVKILTHKYIVLEFWATWCGPCIAAEPHLDSLHHIFNEPDLYFISMTDESKEKVERILKRIPFQSIVVTDQDKKTQILFGDGKKGLETFPLTVLIDNKGFISWIGEPEHLTASIISEFLKGKKINENESKSKSALLDSSKIHNAVTEKNIMNLFIDQNVLFYLEFKKSENEEFSMNRGASDFYFYKGCSLLDIFANIFNQPILDISMPDDLKNEKFDLVYKNFKADSESLAEIEAVILKSLNLIKTKISEKCLVQEVSISNNQLLEKTFDSTSSGESDAGDKLIITN